MKENLFKHWQQNRIVKIIYMDKSGLCSEKRKKIRQLSETLKHGDLNPVSFENQRGVYDIKIEHQKSSGHLLNLVGAFHIMERHIISKSFSTPLINPTIPHLHKLNTLSSRPISTINPEGKSGLMMSFDHDHLKKFVNIPNPLYQSLQGRYFVGQTEHVLFGKGFNA